MVAEAPGTSQLRTIPQQLEYAAGAWPDKSAIEDGEVTLTFSQLKDAALRGARGLIAAGVQHGDRVGIWAPNCWEWIVAGLAIHLVGGAIIPLNTRYRGPEAAYILEKSGASALFTVEGFLNTSYVTMLRDAAGGATEAGPVAGLPKLKTLIVLRGDDAPDTLSWEAFMTGGDAVALETALERAAAVQPDDLADILFTSGTTGAPKGVMATHEQNLRVFTTWGEVVGLRSDDRYLIVNPFFHAFGYKAGWLACLIAGATVLPQPVFDVAETCRRIEDQRVTVLPGPPAIYQSILLFPDRKKRDFSTLRVAVTGAASIPVTLIEQMFDELKLETVLTAYGLTESCGVVTMCRQGDAPELIAKTSGRAIPGVELRIVDSQLQEVPVGEPGQIIVRGYNVMKGYFEDEERTQEAVVNGWLLTGDVGVIDEEGNVQITDRMKDMFITGGFNAYPAEIEGSLARHPAIAASAVIGIPDERMGEVGAAFLVLKDGHTIDEEELYAWCRTQMANYKVPRRFIVLPELPRNATGKVTKFELREMIKAESAS